MIVQGRIAEQLGLTADALAAYQHVQPEPIGYTLSYLPSVDLAQRGIAALAKPQRLSVASAATCSGTDSPG